DFNHPCVIMYSIGNEIPEVGSPNGAAWGRKLTEKIRSLDPTRYVMNSVNYMVTVMDKLRERAKSLVNMEGNFNNALGGNIADVVKQINKSEMVTAATAETFATVDVAGYNYADTRYEMDKELF